MVLGGDAHSTLLLVKGQLCRKQTLCLRFVASVSAKVEKTKVTFYPTVASRSMKIPTACRLGPDSIWTEQCTALFSSFAFPLTPRAKQHPNISKARSCG